MVLNLNITNTEIDLILQEVSGRKPLPPGLLAPLVHQTPLDEATGKERIFVMAFLTLYPTRATDYNTPRV
jgi:hypothetical protein